MLETDNNHHHEEEIEQGKEVEHKESLMDNISEKLHGHDSSSDSGEDEKTSSVKSKIFCLFGREKPVHKVFVAESELRRLVKAIGSGDGEDDGSLLDLIDKVRDVFINIQGSEGDTKKELDVLWRRVKTTATLLTYLVMRNFGDATEPPFC